jgi:CSLREA domain-containing protein
MKARVLTIVVLAALVVGGGVPGLAQERTPSAAEGWAMPPGQVGLQTPRARDVETRTAPPCCRAGSVIAVTTTADELNSDGDCSLREAIQAANTNAAVDACVPGAGADTVLVPAGTYLLAIPGANEDANQTGDLDILDHVTLVGDGAGLTILDGNQLDRVLDMWTGLTVEIDALTVTHGRVQDLSGGGIYNQGTLTLNDVALLANTVVSADYYGGGGLTSEAWALDSSVTLNHCLVQGNSAPVGGGVSSCVGTGFTAEMSVHDTTVSGNTAWFAGGLYGGYFIGATLGVSTLAVLDSTVEGNTANDGDAGGIMATGGFSDQVFATLTVDHSTFQGNTTSLCGGGINIGNVSGQGLGVIATVTDSTVEGNFGNAGGGLCALYGGGGVGASLTVDHTDVRNNTASGWMGAGGGVAAAGAAVVIAGSAIHDNAATCQGSVCGWGGAIAAQLGSQVTVEASTINNNSASGPGIDAGLGGGLMLLLGSTAAFANSTVSGNSAGQYGGGVQLLGEASPASLALVNTTIAGNSAGLGGGAIETNNRGAGATVTFKNSLVAGNSAPANASCENPDEGYGPGILDSLGNNLEDHDLCEFDQPTDLPDTDPLLGPLHDNGGPTWTHALLTGSPAIDAGDDAACPPTDQRGVPRPQGPASDIGAFEAEALHVGNILGSFSLDPYGRTLLRVKVAVHGASHQPAGDVAVDASIWSPVGGPYARTRMTKLSTGMASFPWGSNVPGTWQLCVEDLVRDGHIYDANLNDVPACASWSN